VAETKLRQHIALTSLSIIVTSAKEVIFSPAFVCMYVCLLAGLRRNLSTDSRKFGGNVAPGSRKKPLYFGGNPDHVRVRIRVRAKVRLGLRRG